MAERRILHRTIVAVFSEDDRVDVAERAYAWETAAKTVSRRVYRAEPALKGLEEDDDSTIVWLINIEIESPKASRYDLTKFVASYLPEAKQYYITE